MHTVSAEFSEKMLPKVLLFMIVAVCMIEASYDIYRSSCRRAAIFNIHTENSKLTGDIIAALYADLLSMCVRKCLQAANCRTINYKKATLNGEKNCEILSNDKSSKALQAADGWNYYEALIQKVSRKQLSQNTFKLSTLQSTTITLQRI